MTNFKNWFEANEYKVEKNKFLNFLKSIKGLDEKNIDSLRLSDIHKNNKDDIEKIRKYITSNQAFDKLDSNTKTNIMGCLDSLNCTVSRLVRDMTGQV